MSLPVDQFLQVKCKFQLTSDTESSESNNERVRLCASVDLDKNSTLIVLICSNETSNNHIVTYLIQRRPQNTSASNGPQRAAESPNTTFSSNSNNVASRPPRPIGGLPAKPKPRISVKQIYYHNYNEDIVAVTLSETGNKLALVSASSTIYILPVRNILLNLHAKQLRSSQGKFMYFYDASIIDCCSLDNPIAVAYWDSLDAPEKSLIIVASDSGAISFINVQDKKVVNKTSVDESIKDLKIIKDRFSYSLLITCESLRQFRFTLDSVRQQEQSPETLPSSINPYNYTDEYVYLESEVTPSWDKKPMPINLNSGGGHQSGIGAIRALVPSSRFSARAGLLNGVGFRERSLHLIFYPSPNLITVADVLGSQKSQNSTSQPREARLLRFFSSKQYYYRPQKPLLVCKLTCLDPDEMITHIVLTDKFIVITTDSNRCLVNSRNRCDLKNSTAGTNLDPLVKEITFSNEEKIMTLIKSPCPNDQDCIIDSFLLVTTRSIYSIEARQSCRDMYINLIDSHLGIKAPRVRNGNTSSVFDLEDYNFMHHYMVHEESSKSNLMINSFLSRKDDIYERICSDSKAFSSLFKLELNSLYEAYGDKLLLRGQFHLANRFFQLAKFDHTKILGKYNRLGALKRTDISDYFGYQKSIDHSRKYSLTALCLLESFRKLVLSRKRSQDDVRQASFFTNQQKRSVETIFTIFLNACLEDSSGDSCRLWVNYINFYLNYVGTVDELESGILKMLENSSHDCRLAITLYKAIAQDVDSTQEFPVGDDTMDTPLKSMAQLYNLSKVFSNEFLMRLLERTLDLVPHSGDLDAISDCLGVDSFMEPVSLPV